MNATLSVPMPAFPKRWLVTGAAGFIGSALCEALLAHGQEVIGLDNFSTGFRANLDDVLKRSPGGLLRFVEGDITDPLACAAACKDVDIVLHQAALGSVPRSIKDPVNSHNSNVNGFVNMLVAARDARVKRFVYASSSSVYGDHPTLPKVEANIGTPLSPYAVTKRVNELYAVTFQQHYGLECIGLRYFNVFGRRQNPNGAYAAVIPLWILQLLRSEDCFINGDGETSRDFCYIDNAVQANLRAGLAPSEATNRVYNVACAAQTSLNQLFAMIRERIKAERPHHKLSALTHRAFRDGDVRHSLANIDLAARHLGYHPTHDIKSGLDATVRWYLDQALAAEGP